MSITMEKQPTSYTALMEIAISDIVVTRFAQPREEFGEDALAGLESVASVGVLQPVLVRPLPSIEGAYELIAGERRVRASIAAGLSTIPASVREMDDLTAAFAGLLENTQRVDLNPVEKAKAVRRIMTEYGLTQAQVGAQIGMRQSAVAALLAVLDMPASTQVLVGSGVLKQGHVDPLRSLPEEDQERLAQKAAEEKLSVAAVRSLAESVKPKRSPKAEAAVEVAPLAERGSLTASREWLEAAKEVCCGDQFPTDVGAWVSVKPVTLEGALYCVVGVDTPKFASTPTKVTAYPMTPARPDAEASIKGRVPGHAFTGCTVTSEGQRYVLGLPVEVTRAVEETDWPEGDEPSPLAPNPVGSGLMGQTGHADAPGRTASDPNNGVEGVTEEASEAARDEEFARLSNDAVAPKALALCVHMSPVSFAWMEEHGLSIDGVVELARAAPARMMSSRMASALNAIVEEHARDGALSVDEESVVDEFGFDTTNPAHMAEAMVIWRARKLGLSFAEGE